MIMVVDDTPANLNLLDDMLQANGYRVQVFPKGSQAFRAIESAEKRPDLILLDIMMPEMDGFEVCRQLKTDARFKDIPVLFISALNETMDKVNAFSLGGVDYVTKPFQEQEVLARVAAHLKIVALQRKLREHNENLERMVAERTRELAQANARLLEMARLQNDFLGMISHELRTPANGVLGIGELLIDLCPETDESIMFADLFRQSSNRMRNLLDDTCMIADMEKMAGRLDKNLSFDAVMEEVRGALPEIHISVDMPARASALFLNADRTLLQKAMATVVSLAACFQNNQRRVHMKASKEGERLSLRVDLDALSLKQEQAETFFHIESMARGSSKAQELALAPVVAHKILTAFGGTLELVKTQGNQGCLLAALSVAPQANG